MKKELSKSQGIITRKELSQYYTTFDLGKELVSLIPAENILENIIDLGAGEGALLSSAEAKYKKAKIFGIDIDHVNITKTKLNHPKYKLFQGDSTKESTINSVSLLCDKFDLVIGNPPFKLISLTDDIRSTINENFITKNQNKIRSEVVFLSQGIRLLKDGGILAYILPDGFFTNEKLSIVRGFICENFEILNIREIPAGTFLGTEAKTHILILKRSPPQKSIKLSSMSFRGKNIYITNSNFLKRSDFSFYNLPKSISGSTLKNLGTKLVRGRVENQSVKNRHTIHTTNFKNQYNEFYSFNESTISDERIARTGDIVIPRVGSRSIGKVGVVVSGNFEITDCIIIIRVSNEESRSKIINNLNSDFGINWIKSTAKGVGAKHITLKDLEMFPIV
ncbi:N5-glutamine S-adenosyl-L-methionine-dependent methyltransferase [compost metagenome]